jgi:hypothetical protein
MEFSISGTMPDTYKCVRGLRPTLNSYMFGDAMTLSKIFAEIGNTEKSGHYKSKAEKIKKLMDLNNSFYWDDISMNSAKSNVKNLAIVINKAKVNNTGVALNMLTDSIDKCVKSSKNISRY